MEDGWIEWGGGECPVSDDTSVVVKLDDGHITHPVCAIGYVLLRDNWRHTASNVPGNKVVAYRLAAGAA